MSTVQLQVSDVSNYQKVNDRIQVLRDTPVLHQRLLSFIQLTNSSQTLTQNENVEIEDVEDKTNKKIQKVLEPITNNKMTDVPNIWDSNISQTWKDVITPTSETIDKNPNPEIKTQNK
jgi:hypothetical protein